MATLKAQSAGGRVMAEKQRNDAINKYYSNPNICLNCGKVIEVGNRKVREIRQKKFCDMSCSASYHNRSRGSRSISQRVYNCKTCGGIIESKIRSDGKGYIFREKCDACIRDARVQRNSAMHHNGDKFAVSHISTRTKGDLFSTRKNWQSARSSIRRDADLV